MSCSGRSSWDGAAAGVGVPPGAVLQPKKVSTPSTRRHTIVERVFIPFPPIRSDIPDSRFKQNHILEFQNKNEVETYAHRFPPTPLRSPPDALLTAEARILELLLLPSHWLEQRRKSD